MQEGFFGRLIVLPRDSIPHLKADVLRDLLIGFLSRKFDSPHAPTSTFALPLHGSMLTICKKPHNAHCFRG